MTTLTAIAEKLDTIAARLDQPERRYLSVADAAIYCGLSQDSIRHAISVGDLQSLRPVRGRVSLDIRAIDAWMLATAGRTVRGGRGKR